MCGFACASFMFSLVCFDGSLANRQHALLDC
jgi:hypothetical protein